MYNLHSKIAMYLEAEGLLDNSKKKILPSHEIAYNLQLTITTNPFPHQFFFVQEENSQQFSVKGYAQNLYVHTGTEIMCLNFEQNKFENIILR